VREASVPYTPLLVRLRALLLLLAPPAGAALRYLLAAAPAGVGVLLLSYGAWLAYRPAGFMLAGVVLLADRVAAARQVPARPGDDQ
jgi:hypothetical protein